jgi:hypothetical protein
MKKHDAYFIMSAIFLGLSIFSQTYSIIQARLEFVLMGIFSAFLSWLFMIRAKKAITMEFRELEEILGRPVRKKDENN